MVDADAVVAVRDGRIVRRLGGVGTGDDAFLDPVDVDPTNGQTIYVADRAAGAVLQFTAEGRLVRALAVPDVDPAAVLRRSGEDRSRGTPVAVAAGRSGALYVADAGRKHVLELDAEGAVVRVLGAGLLVDPVDLAVADDRTVWVADAGQSRLQAFDPYGGPTRFVEADGLGRLVGVAAGKERLVAIGEQAGIEFVGAVERRFWRDVHAVLPDGSAYSGEPYRGAAYLGPRLAVLTPTRIETQPDGGGDVD